MKIKHLSLVCVVFIITSMLCGCDGMFGCDIFKFGDRELPPTPPDATGLEIASIVDNSDGKYLDDAIEDFFADENYTYSFNVIKSHYVIVRYTNNTQENVKDALNNGHIKIEDLDTYGIEYIRQTRETPNTVYLFYREEWIKNIKAEDIKEISIENGGVGVAPEAPTEIQITQDADEIARLIAELNGITLEQITDGSEIMDGGGFSRIVVVMSSGEAYTVYSHNRIYYDGKAYNKLSSFPKIADDKVTRTQEGLATQPEYQLLTVVDSSNGQPILPEEEEFWHDEQYIYSFSSCISSDITVVYTDGTTENVKDALKNGHIDITDLDTYGIKYSRIERTSAKYDVVSIADYSEGNPVLPTRELFWQDEQYVYSLSAIKSHYLRAIYADGTQKNIKDALELGHIKIEDLDAYGIEYESTDKGSLTYELKEIVLEDEFSHFAEALEDFWQDEDHVYIFECIKSHAVIVYYTDGTAELVRVALKNGHIQIKDLNTYGIFYMTQNK